jgi:hypothetical protein
MTTTVGELPVAALRAQLSGNGAEHRKLLAQFADREDRVGYSALVHAAFLEAVERRFANESAISGVIQYVADVRARFDEVAAVVDPRVGEQLILEALGNGTTDGIDSRTSSTAMQFLLTALVADARLDSVALDAFIANVKNTADSLLSGDT